jgi:hypothetical protein
MMDLRIDRRRRALVAACIAAVALSSASWAQAPGGGGRSGGTRGGADGAMGSVRPDGMRGAPSADAPLNPGALVQRQLDRLEDELAPTPAQSAVWGAFADSVQKLADSVERVRFEARTATGGPAGAVERLDWIAAGVKDRAALIQKIAEQGRALYATLSPEQKRVADSRMWLPVSLLAVGVAPSAGAAEPPSRGGR